MKVFKDTERTTIANETLFKRTLSCLANVNWNRTRNCNNRIEYHGYSDRNMEKAVNSKHHLIYSHYAISFLNNKTAYIENNNSSIWLVDFDSVTECQKFKKNIFKKIFYVASQKMHKNRSWRED